MPFSGGIGLKPLFPPNAPPDKLNTLYIVTIVLKVMSP